MRKTNAKINLLVLFREYQAQRRMALHKKYPLRSNLEKWIFVFSVLLLMATQQVMICKSMIISRKLVAFILRTAILSIEFRIPLCNAMGYKANSVHHV